MKTQTNAKRMRYIAMVVLILLATLVCFNVNASEYKPKSVSKNTVQLNTKAKTLYVGSGSAQDRYKLVVSPTDGSSKAVPKGVWGSSNAKVAKVDSQGMVTPVKGGQATVSYTVVSGGKKQKGSCKVTVKELKPTSVLIDKPRSVLEAGKQLKLSVTVAPSNAFNKKVSFKSSNPTVASVSSTGVVRGKKPGSATISCQTAAGKLKDSVKITVSMGFSGVTYRVFAIGNANYKGEGKLPGCKKDVAMIKSAFENATFSGKRAQVTAQANLTGAQIRSMLQSMSKSGAGKNDVTVFYYSGHGMNGGGYSGALCGVDWDAVTVKEVQRALDKVPGKVVVLLDCCLSGQYITSKSATGYIIGNEYSENGNEMDAQAFNLAFISAFQQSVSAKALTDSAQKSKYKILTASGPRQASYISNDRNDACSVFTDYLAQALGEDCATGKLKTLPADANGDQVVTLKELYAYVDNRVKAYLKRYPAYKQTTMVWPSGDATPIIARS